jgi:hypothetical protein
VNLLQYGLPKKKATIKESDMINQSISTARGKKENGDNKQRERTNQIWSLEAGQQLLKSQQESC